MLLLLDDPNSLPSGHSVENPRLPPGKTAADVVSDHLRCIYKMLMTTMSKKLPPLDETPIDFWFPIPTICSDRMKDAFLRAIRQAGFKSRPSDTLNLIWRPVGAALISIQSGVGRTDGLVTVSLYLVRFQRRKLIFVTREILASSFASVEKLEWLVSIPCHKSEYGGN